MAKVRPLGDASGAGLILYRTSHHDKRMTRVLGNMVRMGLDESRALLDYLLKTYPNSDATGHWRFQVAGGR